MSRQVIDLQKLKNVFQRMSLSSELNMGYIIDDTGHCHLTYRGGLRNREDRKYTLEQIEDIVENNNKHQKRILSRYFFKNNSFYARLIKYYSTLLLYRGILIPNFNNNNKVEKYNDALNYVDNMHIDILLENITLELLLTGIYCGIILKNDEDGFMVLPLPEKFFCIQGQDVYGNAIVKFDCAFLDTFLNKKILNYMYKIMPKKIKTAYRAYKKGNYTKRFVLLNANDAICFKTDSKQPMFLDVIPAIIKYDMSVDNELEKDLEEIRKIIVQKIPHLNDGTLLFEPEEAAEIHQGTVGMMAKNKNVSVLTSYGEVDSIISKTTGTENTSINNMVQNIYNHAGTSQQLFSTTGNLALETSLNNDLSLMMSFAKQYSNYISYHINEHYADQNINFKYSILPISLYNSTSYIDNTLKMANSGYSFLLPAIATGFSQKDFLNIKTLENNVLKLSELMIPLQSAHTVSGEVGAPTKDATELSNKTIENQESLDKQNL